MVSTRVVVPLAALALLLLPVLAAAQAPPNWQPYPDPAPGLGIGIGEATVSDPEGDTFGVGDPQHDIVQVSAAHDGASVYLDLTFAGPFTPPGSGQADELIAIYEIDADQDAGTGVPGGLIISIFCPQSVAFGVDFVVNCVGGVCDVLDALTGVSVGMGSFGVDGLTFEVEVPLSVIGDDGIMDVSTIVGTIAEPTDCAPDGTFLTTDMVPVELMTFDVE